MIRVLIADSHRIVRHGIRQILEKAGDIIVVGEAGNNEQVLTAIHENEFDVLLVNITIQAEIGLDILKELYRQKPEIKVLILATHSEEQFALRELNSHVYSFLTKESAPEELITAVRKAARGEKYITSTAHLDSDDTATHEALSQREFEILRMLATGKSPTEIARELSISVKTVSTYRARIMAKLQLKNTFEIIRYAIMHGLTK